MSSEERIQRAESTDRQLRRSLSLIDVTALVFGALVGSGWLFASYYTAMAVGPAAFISWIIAGVLMLFVALAFAELSAAIPKSGSIVRYRLSLHSHFTHFTFNHDRV
ncbi:MAG: amino acid permease [Acidilobus sp.]